MMAEKDMSEVCRRIPTLLQTMNEIEMMAPVERTLEEIQRSWLLHRAALFKRLCYFSMHSILKNCRRTTTYLGEGTPVSKMAFLTRHGTSPRIVGGFYDGGNAIKFNFPMSFSMTMLSWSVIEYGAKYEATGELNHVKEIISSGVRTTS